MATLQRNGLTIDVIVLETASPTLAITQFWTTLLMNYISWKGVCVFYPALTFARVGLVSPGWLEDDGSASPHLEKLIEKYTARDFSLILRHDDILAAVVQEFQPDGSLLPWTERTTNDTTCLSVTFSNASWSLRIGRDVSNYEDHVAWKLGGWEGRYFSHGSAILTKSTHTTRPAESWTYSAGQRSTKVVHYDCECRIIIFATFS